jgi:hypothetical protein
MAFLAPTVLGMARASSGDDATAQGSARPGAGRLAPRDATTVPRADREPPGAPDAPGRDRSSVVVQVPKVALQDVLGNLAAETIAFLHRMAEVYASVDTRVVDLSDHIIEALERVSGSGDGTVHGERDLIRLEERRQRIHDGLGDAAMIGRIFGMSGCHRKWDPVRIRHCRRIAVRICVMNGRIRAPECEMVLGIHAGRNRV